MSTENVPSVDISHDPLPAIRGRALTRLRSHCVTAATVAVRSFTTTPDRRRRLFTEHFSVKLQGLIPVFFVVTHASAHRAMVKEVAEVDLAISQIPLGIQHVLMPHLVQQL